MRISRFTMNPFGMNCYILWSAPGGQCIVVDPGMMQQSEKDCHVDHACAARWLANHYGVKIEGGAKDAVIAEQMPLQAARFGLKIDSSPLVIDSELADGDVINFAGEEIRVLETPGHSPGSLSFYCPDSSVVLTGDVVFQSSIGRTDLHGGSFSVLIDSIKTKIMTLPPDTVIAPGHGDITKVADEMVYNPYIT